MEIEKNVENTVRAFKKYITKVINHCAIDYIRKVKSVKFSEILYSDIVDNIVSLSNFDEGTFFESEEIEFTDRKNENAFGILSNKEKQIIILVAQGYSDKEISKKLNITINNVYVSKNLARKKFRKYLEEDNE